MGQAAHRGRSLHAEEDVLIWLRLLMKLHVANAVAVSLLSTAVLVLALKDKSCPSPASAAGIQTAPTAQGLIAAAHDVLRMGISTDVVAERAPQFDQIFGGDGEFNVKDFTDLVS